MNTYCMHMHEERCSLTRPKWDPEWKLGISTDGETKLLFSPLCSLSFDEGEKRTIGPQWTNYLSFSSAPWREYFPT